MIHFKGNATVYTWPPWQVFPVASSSRTNIYRYGDFVCLHHLPVTRRQGFRCYWLVVGSVLQRTHLSLSLPYCQIPEASKLGFFPVSGFPKTS